MGRIYRDLLLLECVDEQSAADVLAVLPAHAWVWQISERVVALDPALTDEVIALLRRAGIGARIVEP